MSAQNSLFGDLPTLPVTKPTRKAAPSSKASRAAPAAALLAPTAAPERFAEKRVGNPLDLLPKRPAEWQEILAKCVCPDPPVLYVSALYTGGTLEAVGDSEAGYWILSAPDKIFPGTPCGWFHRTIYLSIPDALDLHARWPLLPVKRSDTYIVPVGKVAGTFRFAGPDEELTERAGAIISSFRGEDKHDG